MSSTVLSDASYRTSALIDGAHEHTRTMTAHTHALVTDSSTTSGVTSAGAVTEHARHTRMYKGKDETLERYTLFLALNPSPYIPLPLHFMT